MPLELIEDAQQKLAELQAPIVRRFSESFRWEQAIAVLASPIFILIFLTIVLLRSGFATPVVGLMKLAGISLLIVNIAGFGSRKTWLLCGAMLSLLTFVLITLIGLSPFANYSIVASVLASGGIAAALWNLFQTAKRFGFIRTVALLLLGTVIGVYAEGMYFRFNAEHSILYPEAILVGQVHADVLEQAAVVNMISVHGFSSTGVDGLVPLKYHTGSLWIAEGVRQICGLSALEFVAFGYGVLLIPLYASAFFGLALGLRNVIQNHNQAPSLVFWAACVIAMIGLFPFGDDPIHLNFNETILNSDSFLLAIALSLQLFAIGMSLYISRKSRKGEFSGSEKLAIAVLLPPTLGLIGFVKISQMYLLMALLVYLCWRVRWMRSWSFLTGTGLSFLLFLYMLHAETGANKSGFVPFNFDRIAPEWVPYFFVLYFSWPWLFVIAWARFQQIDTVAELVAAFRKRKTILLELVFVAVIAGLIPYLLVNFNSPAWKFFTEFQGVLAGICVAAFLPDLRVTSFASSVRSRNLRLGTALILGLLVAISGHLFMTTTGTIYRLLKANGTVRASLHGLPNDTWYHELREIRSARPKVIATSLANRVGTIRCLDEIGRLPTEQRRTMVLYIPKTNRAYWDMRQVGQGATPFIAPAVAGVPMVDGLPEYEDIGWAAIGWGYPQYKLTTAPQLPTEDLPQAVTKARTDGFQKLFVLRDASGNDCDIQQVDLGTARPAMNGSAQ